MARRSHQIVRARRAPAHALSNRAARHHALEGDDQTRGHQQGRRRHMVIRSSATAPRVSIVLATDSYATLRPVIGSLRSQPDRADIEIVVVGTAEGLGAVD